jgi:hypothetical protein
VGQVFNFMLYQFSSCNMALKPGFLMVVVTVVKIMSHDLSHQPKYNILELKICGVIITREYS